MSPSSADSAAHESHGTTADAQQEACKSPTGVRSSSGVTENPPPLSSNRPDAPSKTSSPSGGVLRNVLANWIGHLIAIVSGFIVPRLINDSLGDVRLGIWDFGWSIVAYMSLLTAGIASSTNRYTARYRASGDWGGLNRAASACLLIFLGTGALAVVITFVVISAMPFFLGPELQAHVAEARALLLLIGISAALQMPLSVPSGVITGCQRYDLVNLIEGGGRIALIVGVAIALFAGAGLWVLGAMLLVVEVASGLIKYVVARRVCPTLALAPSNATWPAIKEVTVFGWKLLLERASRILLYQTNAMMIMFWLGPATLAIYARSAAVALHAHKLLYHFGRVFTPVASEMQARGDEEGLAELLTTSGQRALFVSLPIVAALVLLGDSLLEVWMGPKFAVAWVLPVLAIGHLGAMMHSPAYYILLGMNRHGTVGLASLGLAVLGVVTSALLIKVADVGILGAAIGVAVGVSLLHFVVVPFAAARAVHLSLRRYFLEAVPKPAAACLPLIGGLVLMRNALTLSAPMTLLTGFVIGVPAVLIPYYAVLPPNLRRRLFGPLERVGAGMIRWTRRGQRRS